VLQAIQERIAFSLRFGGEIMKEMGLHISIVRAGKANLFLSKVFCETIVNVFDARIELFSTDGAQWAARGAAFGAGLVDRLHGILVSVDPVDTIIPTKAETERFNALDLD